MEADLRSDAGRYRTPIQQISLLVGAGFVVAGILGFIPGVTTHYGDLSFAGHGSGAKLFGVFQVSILHNLVHLLLGVSGVALSRTRETARAYLVVGGLLYLVLFVYGVVISQGSAANFIPVNSADNILHAALGGSMVVLGVLPESVGPGATETLGGLLAAAAIFAAVIGLAYRPLRLVPLAVVLSLIAVAIGGRNTRLATAATFICAACFVLGMVFAVVTSHPLW